MRKGIREYIGANTSVFEIVEMPPGDLKFFFSSGASEKTIYDCFNSKSTAEQNMKDIKNGTMVIP